MSEGEKQSHFISAKLLDALGGIRRTEEVKGKQISLVDRGAYLWGVEDREKGKGVFRHALLVSRVAYHLGRELKERKIKGYEKINLETLIEGALLHDIDKLYSEDRENLPSEIKKALGIPPDFRESSKESDQIVSSWLSKFGFSPQIYEAIEDHNFPSEIRDNPYWKIILVSDFMVAQKVMVVKERLPDYRTRWIDQRIKQGLPPKVEPEIFEKAAKNIRAVAEEIFGALKTSDREFIEKHKLNSDESQTRWERFLLRTRAKGKEKRAKKLVKALIG